MKQIIITLWVLVLIMDFDLKAQKLAMNLSSNHNDSENTSTNKLSIIHNNAFQQGEQLKYLVYYGWIDAGTAELKITKNSYSLSGRQCYRVMAYGRSLGFTDWVYKVRDTLETYIDKDYIIPWKFVRNVKEGNYSHYNIVDFDHYQNKAYSKKTGEHSVPDNIQDIVSAYYYARCALFNDNLSPGDTIFINTFFDDKIYTLAAYYEGKETVKMDLGEIKCLKLKPMAEEGRMFKTKDSITIWVSDDENHIPVRVESEILVGSVKFDLIEYTGLKNPLSIVKN